MSIINKEMEKKKLICAFSVLFLSFLKSNIANVLWFIKGASIIQAGNIFPHHVLAAKNSQRSSWYTHSDIYIFFLIFLASYQLFSKVFLTSIWKKRFLKNWESYSVLIHLGKGPGDPAFHFIFRPYQGLKGWEKKIIFESGPHLILGVWMIGTPFKRRSGSSTDSSPQSPSTCFVIK